MDPTPHSSRSPRAPRMSDHQTSLDYQPNTFDAPIHHYRNASQDHVFQPDSIMRTNFSPHLGFTGSDSNNQSTTTSNSPWRTPMLHHRDTAISRSSISNILSAEYDPFAPYIPSSASLSSSLFTTTMMGDAAIPAYNFPPSNASQRSSVSSAPTSDAVTLAGSIQPYTPRAKAEEPIGFPSGSETFIQSPPHLPHGLLGGGDTFQTHVDPVYYQETTQIPWSKVDYSSLELPSISSLPIPRYDRRSESQERVESAQSSQRRSSNPVARTRQPRRLTTKEEANFQCHVKGCGKLFGRSYNYKAHMETHDTGREYPFPCIQPNCEKKFVRKTDLQRHHQSVHMKQRNYRCDYCSRLFARKDTLRRHMEDGCSKRFDIEVVDYRPPKSEAHDSNTTRNSVQPDDISHPNRPSPYVPATSFNDPTSMLATQLPVTSPQISSSMLYSSRQVYLPQRNNGPTGW